MHVTLRHRTGEIDLGLMPVLPDVGDQVVIEGTTARYAERVDIERRVFERRGRAWVCILIPPRDEVESDA